MWFLPYLYWVEDNMSIDLAGDIWVPAVKTKENFLKENFLKENSEMFLNEYDIICLIEGRTARTARKRPKRNGKTSSWTALQD